MIATAVATAAGLVHERVGDGEPLVLVHGLGSRRQVWAPVVPGLAGRLDVVLVDLPGFGQTGGPAPVDAGGRVSVFAFADALERFLDALELPAPHLAGNSLGGAVVLELGRRGRAASVTAFAPIGFWRAPGVAWARTSIGACRGLARAGAAVPGALAVVSAWRPARAALGALFYARPAAVEPRELAGAAAALAAATGYRDAGRAFPAYRFDADPTRLGGLAHVPVALAWGTRDAVLPFIPQGRRARLALPEARHVVLSACGHLPFTDDPAACTEVLLTSCQQRRRRR